MLAVGRLSREKGHAHLIRAAAAWKNGARLVIIGDGPERPALERLARDLGVGAKVTLPGMTNDVTPFYGLADVFVLPSLSEGSPNVLLEAMASRLPIVATRVGGVPEIAEDGVTALLGPAKDPAFLARAVDRLFAEPELGRRLGEAARRNVLSHHTPEQRAATLSRLYAALVRATSLPGSAQRAGPVKANRRRPLTRVSSSVSAALTALRCQSRGPFPLTHAAVPPPRPIWSSRRVTTARRHARRGSAVRRAGSDRTRLAIRRTS